MNGTTDTAVTALLAVWAGVLGLLVGSFLNVVIARVPVGASVVRPRSACPQCGHTIRSQDNVPVLSWILLRGRCRDCALPIPVRYPLVEAGTSLFFAATAWRFGLSLILPAFLFLAALSVVLTLIDLDTMRLPDALVLPAYPVAAGLSLLAATLDGWAPIGRALIGGLALWLLYGGLWLVTGGRGMGFGDVKLSGLLGGYLAWLGWGELVVGGFGAFVLGGIVGVGLVLAKQASRRSAIPFGPFMIAAAWVAVFAGDQIADGYLRLFGLA